MKKIMMSRKNILSAAAVGLLAAVLALGAAFAPYSPGKTNGEKDDADSPAYAFKIGLVSEKNDRDSALRTRGFTDALTDLLGEGCSFESTPSDAAAGDPSVISSAVTGCKAAGCQLLYVSGDGALSLAHSMEKDIPVVAVGVTDFPSALGLPAAEWDGRTGTNVTGVSAFPDMEAVLSLLIEATPDLSNVGLLSAEGDEKALLQNRALEAYLDEAGIPWKEYALPLAVDPEAAAAAEAAGTPLPTLESMAALAAAECSALFLPAHCALQQSAAAIGEIAKSMGKPLVTADRTAGASALVCAYQSPYVEGYMAGELAVKILRDGYAPEELPVETPSAGFHKLYKKSYADALGRVFPKSFSEFDGFFDSFDFSSDVDRKAEIERNT